MKNIRSLLFTSFALLPEASAAAVERTLAAAAYTGQRGDGKIYACSLESARRISSGETGESAV